MIYVYKPCGDSVWNKVRVFTDVKKALKLFNDTIFPWANLYVVMPNGSLSRLLKDDIENLRKEHGAKSSRKAKGK